MASTRRERATSPQAVYLDHLGPSPAPHAEVLLAVARPPSDTTREERLITALSRVADWQRLLEDASGSGLLPLLSLCMTERSAAAVPPEWLARLRLAFRNNVVHCIRASSEVLRMLKGFEAAGIRAVPFKGPVLAQSVYGDVAARQFSDLDILIDPERLWDASELLVADGYSPELEIVPKNRRRATRQAHEFAFIGGPIRATVELHTALSPPAYQTRLSFDTLWAGRNSVDLLGRAVVTLGPEDCLLMLCVHAAQHEWRRLEHVAAVAHLLALRAQFDWSRTLQIAGDYGCLRRCLIGFALADRVCGVRMPAGAHGALVEDPATRGLASAFAERLIQGPSPQSHMVPGLFSFVRTVDSRAQMAHALARTAFVPGPRDWTTSRLPNGLMFLHYPARPLRLARTYVPDWLGFSWNRARSRSQR